MLTPTAVHPPTSTSSACGCQPPAPAPVPASTPIQHSPAVRTGALLAAGAGGVLLVGTVLVSLLLAVAVTAASVTVCALVLRSLLKPRHTRR
ncbi:hypothetical protein IF129_23925 [Streptomyces chumphonensis]|uniref:SpdD protein n=1 Tax=Streptomyces chumphonensis TaxID=1214925 RepID=A0A927F305_9ACTN|nr:hypothetical protein [Streptomyces chumphonensis]